MATQREHLRQVFDSDALLYDAARPGYPLALFDDLVALAGLPAGGRVLEIGCGTGQATIPLARRGYHLVAVELGAHLAAVARRNLAPYPDATVVVGDFESWPAEDASFDLVTAATAFHWVDPAVRYVKAARILRPGRALAPFATQHVKVERDGGFFEVAQEVYRRVVPAWAADYKGLLLPEEVPDDEAERIAASGLFEPVTTRRYVWEVEHDAVSFVRLLSTFSGFRALEPTTRERLLNGLAELVEAQPGGRIVHGYLTMLCVARRR